MNEGDGQHSQGYPELSKPSKSDTGEHTGWPLICEAKHLQPLLACLHWSISCHITEIICATWLKAVAGSSSHTRDIRVAPFPLLAAVRCRFSCPNNPSVLSPEPEPHPTLQLPFQPACHPLPSSGPSRSQRLTPCGRRHGGTGNKEPGEDSEWGFSPGHKSLLRL